MQFLKEVSGRPGMGSNGFSAKLWNGKTLHDYDMACFLMVCQDQNYTVSEMKDRIKMGKMIDPMKNWAALEAVV